ncbi:MAG: lytic transglycosylase domain-containing protein [Hydrogenophaga sp.]|uniref:lytic transglycosylase domain-containing protein n=1 Tax=Hydrogenophaga sp. TaxID=1904254 RepID=UPI0027365172|nr:lytic transglycosylase domain-containing protein [Hydrogenophaga sp.]MDP3350473.1 lytic transglycosylase domain-containing protein [Hydrogenophaga sp.]
MKLLEVAVCWLLLACSTASQAQGQTAPQQIAGGDGGAAVTHCVQDAAGRHSVNPWILMAILKVESNFKPSAVNKNPNGTVDLGLAQINSMHLKELGRYGIGKHDLLDPCVSTYVAAWHLAKQVREFGNTWYAVGAYHSRTRCFNDRYVGLVWNTLVTWGAAPGPTKSVMSLQSCGFKGPVAAGKAPRDRDQNTSVLAFDE